MAFSQQVESEFGGSYFGIQVESTPANSDAFILEYSLLSQIIPPSTIAAIALSESPLVFPAPADAELIVGVTINGVYTEDFTYDPDENTITVNVVQLGIPLQKGERYQS